MKKRTTVAIIGVTGFLGRNLSRGLDKAGFHVIGLSRSGRSVFGCSEAYSADMMDKESIMQGIRMADVVIHLAGITSHDLLVGKPYSSLRINIEGTLNILDAFIGSDAHLLLYPSSGKVYGHPESLPIKESQALNPVTFLGNYKKIIEDILKYYSFMSHDGGSDGSKSLKKIGALRIFNIYGPEQRETFLVPTILGQVDKREVVLGDVSVEKDFMFVEDMVSAFISVMNHFEDFSNFFALNIGSGKRTTAKVIADSIKKITGKRFSIKQEKNRMRPEERYVEQADISLMKSIGWAPEFTLEEGLKKTIRSWY